LAEHSNQTDPISITSKTKGASNVKEEKKVQVKQLQDSEDSDDEPLMMMKKKKKRKTEMHSGGNSLR